MESNTIKIDALSVPNRYNREAVVVKRVTYQILICRFLLLYPLSAKSS